MSLATAYSQERWAEFQGKVDSFNAAHSDLIALGGFEMTWSGGPGHINTWNTPGIVSRNNATLNNKTADAGMKAYYALLSRPEGPVPSASSTTPAPPLAISRNSATGMPSLTAASSLVEVGNGEGAIGAGGYYPQL